MTFTAFAARRTHPRATPAYALAVMLLISACGVVAQVFKRPQEPDDRPYHVETVRFAGGPGVALAGELTMPRSGGPFRAVALISGSGPQDRDETVAGHKPFLVLSDHLTRAGYAVLRYDDRGVADSTGDYEAATLTDFADDAVGAYRFLESRPEIDPAAIGFIGHSEGGYIAPAAAPQVDPAFMIFLAGAARPLLPDVVATQTIDLMRAQGSDEAEIERTARQIEEASEILARPAPLTQIRQALDEHLRAHGVEREARLAALDFFVTPWGVLYAKYDPAPALRALSMPVLALFGENDLQVSAREEAPFMRAALGHPRSEVAVIGGVNHLFQPSDRGLPSEYAQIETTMSPVVLRQVSDWLDSL